MPEREVEIEQELERQYGLLTDYDRLLGLTIDPTERERYKYNQEIIQENITRLEKGLEGLPITQLQQAEQLLRKAVENLNTGSGQQWNVHKQVARGDVISAQMVDKSVHYHYYGQTGPEVIQPVTRPLTVRPGNEGELAPAELSTEQELEFVGKLLACEAMRNRKRRDIIISLLPEELQYDIETADAPRDHVLNIVRSCNRREGGLKQLVEALHKIEGDTKAWNGLVTYLKGLQQLGG